MLNLTRENKCSMIGCIKDYLEASKGNNFHREVMDAIWLWSAERSYMVSGDDKHTIFHIENSENFVKVDHKTFEASIFEAREIA